MAITSTYFSTTIKAEFQANTFEGGNQLLPHVTGLANGGFAVAYHSGTVDGGSLQVDFYDAAHEVVGTYRLPYSGPATVVGQPQVIQLENSNVVVAWHDANEGFRARIYTEAGAEVSLELAFSFDGTAENLQLSPLTGGGFVATYDIGGHTYQGRFSENGAQQGGGYFQVDTGLVSAHDSTVTALSGGGYVVTYTDTNPAAQTIHARIYNADGSTKVADFVAATSGDNTQAQVVGIANDRWAVVYKDTGWQGADAGNSGITLQIFDSNGLNVTPDLYQHVNAPSIVVESDPDITVLENGFIVVTWTRQLSVSDHDIMARVYTPAGVAVTEEFTITASNNLDTNPTIAGLLSGKFITAWQDNSTDGDGGQITAEINEITRSTTGDAFDNTYTGDSMRDDIAGLGGNDTLDGQGGNDVINGGVGNDTLYGGDGDDQLNGGSDDDTIHGGDGNDRLFGADGKNTLQGGMGDDTYVVQNAADMIVEMANEGKADRIEILVDYTLAEGANIEILATNLETDTLNFKMVGNSDANHIIGNYGDNTIEGKGGVDTLEGLKGNDVYIVDNAADVVIELAGNGTADRVMARVDYTLAEDVDIELFTTTKAAGTTAINLTGNALAQEIIGNAGVNTLKDGGGAGDTLRGMTGDDTYLVYSDSTVVMENAAGGSDRVLAGVDFVLGAGQHVEALATTKAAGTSAIDLTGNSLAQTITGNAGANVLSDGGVGAADILKGLGGNDTYRVYNAADVIEEAASQGATDRVMAAVDYKLAAGVHIEVMTTNGSTGTAAIKLTGNELAQQITGNYGDNRIEGREGNDTLTGLKGEDTFVFNTKLGAANVDTITDFNVADDRFLLSDAIFKALDTGTLAASEFRANNTGMAQDANDHIVYEQDTGKLFYDADGVGGSAGIHFATVTAGLALTNADFVVA